MFLPFLFIFLWMTRLLHTRSNMKTAVALTVVITLSAVIVAVTCVSLVWSQSKDDQSVKNEVTSRDPAAT
jgi:hypothetical protein